MAVDEGGRQKLAKRGILLERRDDLVVDLIRLDELADRG
jgi:hypothetical protein